MGSLINNMKLENQVVSLELSVKIHNLGITAPSLFYTDSSKSKNDEIEMWDKPDYCLDNINRYTVAELGEMLPKYYETHKVADEYWFTGYIKEGKIELQNDNDFYETEANARAKMLIYLKENNLIK